MSLKYPRIDNYEKILRMNKENQMNSIISSNFNDIKAILNNILLRIKKKYLPDNEKYILIDTLRFIDNLNIFIDDSVLNEFSNLMTEIKSKLIKSQYKGINKETKNDIIYQIDYTKLTLITYKKEIYKKLFFNQNDNIIKEIENDLEEVIKDDYYDGELFQQIQNIFWILKNKIKDQKEIKRIENKLKKIKRNINYYYYNYYKNQYSNNFNGKIYFNKYDKKERHKKYNGEQIAVEITTYFKSNKKSNIEEKIKEDNKNNKILEKEQNIIFKNINLNNEENINNHENTIKKENINKNININENTNDKRDVDNKETIKNDIIQKNKINEKIQNKDENFLSYEQNIYNIKNNIYDFYLIINQKFKPFSNNNINSDLNGKNEIKFHINYILDDNNIIEENYKKIFKELKEVNTKQFKHNKKNSNENIINELMLKLNVPLIILKSLEEIVKEDLLNSNKNIINDKNIDIDFENVLKIEKEEEYFDLYEDKFDFKEKEELKNILLKDYIFYNNNYLKNNSQILSKSINDLVEKYNNNNNENKTLINFILSEYNNLKYKEDFKYLINKISILENSFYSSINLYLFEKYILLPLYLNSINNSRKNIKENNNIIKKYITIINNVFKGNKENTLIDEITPYGSFVNNFADENGDVDICIVPKNPWFKYRSYAHKIMNKINYKKIGTIKLFHIAKSFYLISISDKKTNIDIDITIHNLLPILNSKLIKIYSEYDQRFHIMGIYLKYWSKLNKVHGASCQYLSSYALLIMLIHFLQNIVKPRILPNLQKIPINDDFNNPEYKNEEYKYYHGKKLMTTNIHFENNIEKIDKYMNYINNGEKNKESVGNLLLKFFEYYTYFYDRKQIISIKNNSESSINREHNFGFYIEDPFEEKQNLGKHIIYNTRQYKKFIDCMKKEINNILSGEYIKRLSKIIKNEE